VAAEGIAERPLVIGPRWAESAPRSPGSRSALIHCDLILRDDGSAVFLDGAMAANSTGLGLDYLEHGTRGLSWDEFVSEHQRLPAECLPEGGAS
jgi:hypothetical protein